MKQGDDYYITGHMAYGNPQWKTFEIDENVLVIFQGPHAYISSSWYKDENVPTWNYQAVHVYGTASIMRRTRVRRRPYHTATKIRTTSEESSIMGKSFSSN